MVFRRTQEPPYNVVHYSMVLDITQFYTRSPKNIVSKQKCIDYRQPSLYGHSLEWQNSLECQFDCHATFTEKVTVSHKLYKNIVFNALKKHMFWIFVRIASLRQF